MSTKWLVRLTTEIDWDYFVLEMSVLLWAEGGRGRGLEFLFSIAIFNFHYLCVDDRIKSTSSANLFNSATNWIKIPQLDICLFKSIAECGPPLIQKINQMNGIICHWALRLLELLFKGILGCRRLTGSLSRISARWRGFFEKSSIIRVAVTKKKKKAWPCSSASKAQIKRASNGGGQDFYSSQLLSPTQAGWQVRLNYTAAKHITSQSGLHY